jgi:hypothetical protein
MEENLHHSTEKGLIFRICKVLQKLNSKRINNPINTWASKLSRQFSEKEIQMANKYMKKYSTCLVIKEMKVKATLSFLSLSMIKKQTITNDGQDVGNEHSYTVDGKAN